MNSLVPRSSGEEWLGRVESDAKDGSAIVKGFDFSPGAGVVDVNFVARCSGEPWFGRVEGDGRDWYVCTTDMVKGFDFSPGESSVDANLLVVRSSGQQWLGRVEGDGVDGRGMIGEGGERGVGGVGCHGFKAAHCIIFF